jgi:hypothetical protein
MRSLFFRAACIVVLAALAVTAHAADDTSAVARAKGVMPTLQAESLAQVPITLPQGLPAARTVVMIGFEFDHQKVMDTWLEKMNLRAEQKPWLQLHGIGRGYGLISGFINSRKRPYFPDPYLRERVVPVYTDVDAMLTAMGLPTSRKEVYVTVVKRDGQMLAWAQGDYDTTAAQRLLEALAATD